MSAQNRSTGRQPLQRRSSDQVVIDAPVHIGHCAELTVEVDTPADVMEVVCPGVRHVIVRLLAAKGGAVGDVTVYAHRPSHGSRYSVRFSARSIDAPPPEKVSICGGERW